MDRHSFMSSLIPAPIDREVAKDGLCLERQQCFPQLFGVETTSLPYRVYQKLASGISSRRLDRRRMVELFLIGRNELLVSSAWATKVLLGPQGFKMLRDALALQSALVAEGP